MEISFIFISDLDEFTDKCIAVKMVKCTGKIWCNFVYCRKQFFFSIHPEISVNLRFSDVFRGYRKEKLAWIRREKCPYSEFFWSVFSRIQTEYGEITRKKRRKKRLDAVIVSSIIWNIWYLEGKFHKECFDFTLVYPW